MSINKIKLLLVMIAVAIGLPLLGQITTSSLSGNVLSESETLPGVLITARHQPSGTVYNTMTNENGKFIIQGMRTGGPYEVEFSMLGYKKTIETGVVLKLGETRDLKVGMIPDDKMLGEVVVVAQGGLNANKMGAATNFDNKQISNTPTISRSVFDIAKLTPQAVSTGSGLSFSGTNNRYNSFQIDGSVNNDVFGLSSSGTNGGQSGANPISLDAIEELQVVIAPFDVRQSGFTGGGVNAITKSGTNILHGSAYLYYNNQDFAGKTPGKDVEKRQKLSTQSQKTFGATLGGSLIKDKLFFFGNIERVEETYPTNYNVGNGSNITVDEANEVIDKLKQLTNGKYDGGGYAPQDINTKSTKVLGRLDWNISDKHKASVRYSFLDATRYVFSNSQNTLRLNDNGYTMKNTTNSFVGELNSSLTPELYNEFRISYNRVRDKRVPQGSPFPYVNIQLTNSRRIELGTERYSAANELNQDIWALTNNLTYTKGDHSYTFGTHNEFFQLRNLFIRENYGSYTYGSLDDFLSVGTANEVAPIEYNYSFSRQDITGSKDWAPTFKTAQLGFYVQDDWRINDNFKLTYGIRMDIPLFLDNPIANDQFNSSSIAKQYEVATNQMPKSTPMFSPRAGFRWNVGADKKTIVRGGAGLFTGRIPFVWISNSFSNTGVEYSRTRLDKNNMAQAVANGFKFEADPSKQYVPSSSMTSEIDVVSKDFKFPQVFRVNLAVDKELFYGIRGSLEALYTKTLNNINYKNLAVVESGKYLNNGGDMRPLYTNAINPKTGKSYTNEYTGIIYLDNTSQGYTYSFTAKLDKQFDFGLGTMLAYTYGRSKSVNDGTSSQALSNWQYNETWRGGNNPELAYSDFDTPSRIVGVLSYRKEYGGHFATTVGLTYNGQSGSNYSMVYYNDINGDGARGNDVMYVPTDLELSTMKFKDIKNTSGVITADQQREALGSWINENKTLRNKKGKYLERNSLRTPFEHHFDLHIAQDFYLNVSGKRHTLQVNFDILNIGNLLKRSWGIYNYASNSYSPVTVSSVSDAGVPTFQFTKPAGKNLYTISDYSSRWRAQIGVRYIF